MKIFGHDHVYPIPLPFRGNRSLPADQRVVVHLQGVSQAEVDQMEAARADIIAVNKSKPAGEIQQLLNADATERVGRKFKGVDNLEIEGVGVIKTWEEFYRHAPQAWVDWVTQLVHNSERLAENEAKNSSPGSGTA